MARTPADSKENVTVLSRGPVPEVDLSAGAQGARMPRAVIFDGAANPAPQGVAERADPTVRDPAKEEVAPEVRRLVVANRGGKRVNLRAPGNPMGGTACTLHFGKVVDDLNYDFAELRRSGVILKTEAQFEEMSA